MINDKVGNLDVVLIGDAATRTVRAYQRDGRRFSKSGQRGMLSGQTGSWRIEEGHLQGPEGARLPRVAGHVSYWFAWDGYLGVKSELFQDTQQKTD